MRGDSVRDFYAKTLALVGLGLLAGAGALVDYWPTSNALPVPGPAIQLPALASALPVPAERGLRTTLPKRESRKSMTIAAPIDAFVPSEATPVPASFSGEGGGMAVVGTAAVRRPAPIAADAVAAPLGTEIPLSAPRASATVASSAARASSASAAVDEVNETDANGFMAAAFKKTGDSLAAIGTLGAKTGAKTGSSIVGAFRAVGSAMHKALPL